MDFSTRHLPSQTQAIIRKHNENDELSRKNHRDIQSANPSPVFSTALFMRLGINPITKNDGIKTLQSYENFCNKAQCVWFSTDSLTYGMEEKQRTKFVNAIKQGNVVYIYFVAGKKGNGKNEIEYRGEVTDIKTDSDSIKTPDKKLTPAEWTDVKNKIWIELRNIHQYTKLTVSDFVVESSGKLLSESIAHSQYHFGYIKQK